MTLRIGYYPGCSLKGSSREYDESLHAIQSALDMELVEIDDWNCCGASAAHSIDRELSLALPARILSRAEAQGIDRLLVPCAACYNRLASVAHHLDADPSLRERIGRLDGCAYGGSIKIMGMLDVLDQLHDALDPTKVISPFTHAVACYYGCLLVRPPDIMKPERVEDPMIMDRLMTKIGANPVTWAFKTECCGAGFSVSRVETVGRLSSAVLEDAERRGAEAVIVACPMCHANLDLRRKQIERYVKKKYRLPVLYITQAIGLAVGIDHKILGLHRHMVPVRLKKSPAPAVHMQAEREGVTEVSCHV